ncbi:MAG: AraC family transcriptional regulator [Bacteroidaceae bacterium]
MNDNKKNPFYLLENEEHLPSYSFSDIVRLSSSIKVISGLENDLLYSEEFVPFSFLSSPCRVDGLAIMLLLEGTVNVRINLQEITVEAGDVVVNLPDNIVQINHRGEPARGLGLLIGYDFLHRISEVLWAKIPMYAYLKSHPVFRPLPEDLEVYKHYMHEVISVSKKYEGEHKLEVIRGLLLAFMFTMFDSAGRVNFIPSDLNSIKGNSQQLHLFEQFMDLLEKHHSQERTVQFYAEKLMFTPKYLSRLIREVSGRGATEWIIDFVMLEAKQMLRNSSFNIKEIAYHLNFATPSLFSRYFRTHAKCTPQNYRNDKEL